MASFHNWLIIVLEIVGHKIDYKGLRLAIIAIFDMVLLLLFYEKDLVFLTGTKKKNL